MTGFDVVLSFVVAFLIGFVGMKVLLTLMR